MNLLVRQRRERLAWFDCNFVLFLFFFFFFVARNSTNVLSGLMLTLRRYAFIKPYQGSEILDFQLAAQQPLTRSGSLILLCFKDCSFFWVALCFRVQFKIAAVFFDPEKEVFPAQESHSSRALKHFHYLTYIDLKEVVDLFLRSTQVGLFWHIID